MFREKQLHYYNGGIGVKKWRVDYVVGNTYKVKYVLAANSADAIKKSRVKNIVDLNIVEE